MQISFLKKSIKKKKKKSKQTRGCETLPGIPDQCRTPERPQKHTTTNTHHRVSNWSQSKTETPLYRNRNREKLPLLYNCGTKFTAWLSLTVYESVLFGFVQKTRTLQVHIQILCQEQILLLLRRSQHPLCGEKWGALIIHMNMGKMWSLDPRYLYSRLQSTGWDNSDYPALHHHIQTTIILSSGQANRALMLQHAVPLECKKMQLLADTWHREMT